MSTEPTRIEPETAIAHPAEPQVFEQWRNGIRIQHRAHSQAASLFARRGRILAVATLMLTTIVGTSIFASLNSSPSTGWKIVAGLTSIAAALLAAVQAFLTYPEIAERHRRASLRLGVLRHRLEQGVITGTPISQASLEEIRVEWDDIASEAPPLPQRLNRRAEAEVRETG